MKTLTLFIVVILTFFSNLIYANDNFHFSGKIICELSASFIVFDFDNKIAIRNNYSSSKYQLSNYEIKKNKFRKTTHSFSWYDIKNNFLGYWTISDNSRTIEEIKFDKEGKTFIVRRFCKPFNYKNIGELIWD